MLTGEEKLYTCAVLLSAADKVLGVYAHMRRRSQTQAILRGYCFYRSMAHQPLTFTEPFT